MSISISTGNLQGLSSSINPASALTPAVNDQAVKQSATTASASPKIQHPVDQAVISSTSNLLTEALSGSDVRLDKINPLQSAIAAGTYNVPSSAVADKLIASQLGY